MLVVAIASISLSSCTQEEKMCWDIVGTYENVTDEYISDDVDCDLHIVSRHRFGLLGFRSSSDVTFVFHFNNTFDFSDIEMYYEVVASGDWSYADSLICIGIDRDNVECNFRGSSASRYVEQTMVRYLRKYVNEKVFPDVEKHFLLFGTERLYLDEISDSTLILSHRSAGRAVSLKRK